MGEFLSPEKLALLVEVGLAACHRGRVVQARRIFQGLLTAKKDYPPAVIGLAFSHLVVNEFDQAEDILKNQVLAKDGNDPEALALLGLNYQLSDRLDEAVGIYKNLAAGRGPAAEMAQALLNG